MLLQFKEVLAQMFERIDGTKFAVQQQDFTAVSLSLCLSVLSSAFIDVFTVSQCYSSPLNDLKCGNCSALMSLRTDGESRLLHCDACAQSLRLPSRGEVVPHPHICPLCKYQVQLVSFPSFFFSLSLSLLRWIFICSRCEYCFGERASGRPSDQRGEQAVHRVSLVLQPPACRPGPPALPTCASVP
jgi:hypothetical protein